MEIFQDISKNRLLYKRNIIPIIIDDDDVVWFSAREIAIALGYKKTKDAPRNAIRTHVNKRDKKQLHAIKTTNKRGHPHSLYINESGLYRLIIRSRLKTAEKFSDWVTHEVLPSIRKYGKYKLIEEHKKELHSVFDLLNFLEHENKKLKADQCKTKYPDGGIVYVIDYSSTHEQLYRIGMTGNMNARKKIYDTHMAHNLEVIHFVESDCPLQLETCIRTMLYKYRYSDKKDFYVCKLSTIKAAFTMCITSINEMNKQKGGSIRNGLNNMIDKKMIIARKKEKSLQSKISKLEHTLSL